jgi:hypothetical protein
MGGHQGQGHPQDSAARLTPPHGPSRHRCRRPACAQRYTMRGLMNTSDWVPHVLGVPQGMQSSPGHQAASSAARQRAVAVRVSPHRPGTEAQSDARRAHRLAAPERSATAQRRCTSSSQAHTSRVTRHTRSARGSRDTCAHERDALCCMPVLCHALHVRSAVCTQPQRHALDTHQSGWRLAAAAAAATLVTRW